MNGGRASLPVGGKWEEKERKVVREKGGGEKGET